MRVISRPNRKKLNPSLAHLRACVVDCLQVPEPTSRYHEELRIFLRDRDESNLVYLKPADTKKPEKIGNIRI